MIRLFSISFAFIYLFFSCFYAEEKNGQFLYGLWASVESILIESIVDNKITFKTTATVGDPCHEFERTDINIERLEVKIRIFSKRQKDRICAQVIGTIDIPITVELLKGNSYNFHFWRLDDAPLDTTIYIP